MANQILWSKGPFITEYSKKKTESESINMVKAMLMGNNGFLWIRLSSYRGNKYTDLDHVANNIHLLKSTTILMTSDGDRPVPSSYNKRTISIILNCPYITKWYTQNYDRTIIHPKLTYLPIGFDFHTKCTLVNNTRGHKLAFMRHCREHTKTKIQDKVFCDSHNSKTHAERAHLYDILKNNSNITFLNKKVSFIDITRLYNKHLFVLSPRGAGFDCHRTWELFLAGCIVITSTSPLDIMFQENNLPVVILKDWSELNSDLSNKLKIWREEHIKKTNVKNILPKLMFSYWIR